MTMKRAEPFKTKDLEREYKTVCAMIKLHCRKLHNSNGLCDECKELLIYSEARIRKCPHYKSKIPCKNCSVHCYREPYKEKIRKIMRFSGPRMILYHPILALYHILSLFKKDQLQKQGRE
jgi:hypothetical protein